MKSRGTMINGFASSYNFSILDILKEAWEGIKGYKATVWGAIGYIFLIILAFTFITIMISYAGVAAGLTKETMQSISNLIINLVMPPFVVGFVVLGIRRSVALPVRAKQIFRYLPRYWEIIGVYILQSVILGIVIFVGLLFFIMSLATDSLFLQIICGLISLMFLLGFVCISL